MKNNYSRLVIIALITIIVFLYALTVKGYAAGLPATLQETVTGVVTDEQGMPLPGVTITVKGTNRGTSTNLDGEYKIAVEPQGILVFSYLGFKIIEVPVDGRREINVRLVEDITALDEVQINAGYYNTTRRESTGNISRVTAEEIEHQPVISPLQALQGRMAGVEIIPGGDQPGMAATIKIRGRNSLREEGNLPLYIIDGVPVNSTPIESNSLLGNTGIDPFNTLNLSNIQSIEVLKDADATAIYGSRGANGVVLITTKKGFGRAGFEAQIYTGTSTLPNRIEMLKTGPYLEIRRQAFENDGIEPTEYDAYDLVLWDQNRYTDWQDFFLGGTATVQDINLASNGGSGNTTYRLSGSYHKQGTIYPWEYDYQKFTGGINLDHFSQNKKWRLNFSLNYGLDDNSSVGDFDIATALFSLPPNAPKLFNEDGSLHWVEWSEAGIDNPISGFFNSNNIQSNNLVSTLNLTYDISPGLSLRTNFGYRYFQSKELLKRPKRSFNPAYWDIRDHSSSHLTNYTTSWIIEPQINYDKSFGKISLNTILGGSIQERNSSQTAFTTEGYVAESLIGNISAAKSISYGRNNQAQYRYAAAFGRLALNWNKKYLVNLTGRRDGSSRFGPGKRLANFWAVGGAWVFSEEPLLNGENKILSFGKLRASYGTSGSDQIGDYQYLDAYEATQGPGGLYPTQLFNPNYSWEVNKKLEAAVDLGFLNDRINLSVSWYRNRSSNQLVGYSLPSITGFGSVQANLPATVQNQGVELEFSTYNFQTKDFSWETFFNITIPENKLVSYPGIEQSSYANVYKVGQPLAISLLYKYEGLDPETGFYKVADINNDGRLDYNDRVAIQDFGRKFYGGINNNFNYNNFSLQFLWEFTKQKGIFDLFEYGYLANQGSVDLETLEEGGQYQRISQSYEASDAYYYALFSTFPVVDASYLRLKSLSLGFQFPSSVMKSMGLKDGKVFLAGQNLYTLTSYKGMDPELPENGRYFGGLRTITGGLQVQF
ncbi:SusC/RagA family TonB-linked outer membrane protein [Salinimicrobium sp. GXAS 041]|uniref:SusC/RagA family TonB-linked outer membrane protein n=1 Tax=Salinimicrobium sp. GXAS 041 TaxID=3400806 RepID=UPI003C72031B